VTVIKDLEKEMSINLAKVVTVKPGFH